MRGTHPSKNWEGLLNEVANIKLPFLARGRSNREN